MGKTNGLGGPEAYYRAAGVVLFARPAVYCVWATVLYSVFYVYNTKYLNPIGTGAVKRTI